MRSRRIVGLFFSCFCIVAHASCKGTVGDTESHGDGDASVCGNEQIDNGEHCDRGTLNGEACTPPTNGACDYCDTNCQWASVSYVPPCVDEMVASECVCGTTTVSSGYCCGSVAQAWACDLITTCSDGEKNQGETDTDCGGPCPPCNAGHKVFHIEPSGNDELGDGSRETPWKTLAHACESVHADQDIIHIGAGTYDESRVCVLAPGVWLEGEGVSSVITSTTLQTEWEPIIRMRSDPTVNGDQSVSYVKFDGSNHTAAQAIDVRGRNNVRIHHCDFVDFKFIAVGWTTARTTSPDTEPGVSGESPYLTGSEFFANNVTNCAGEGDGWYRGALLLGGQDGMLIHDNHMVESDRGTGQGWPIKFWYWGGWSKGVKIYDNHLEKTEFSVWDFALESNYELDMEIFDNRFIGSIDLNHNHSVHIHDNLLGPDTPISDVPSVAAIILEFESEDVIVERNTMKNVSPCIMFTPRSGAEQNITIRYNICRDVRTTQWYFEALRVVSPSDIQIDGFYLFNNVFYGYPAAPLQYGVQISSGGSYTGHDMKFVNNIFANFDVGYMQLSSAGTIDGLRIQNNIPYSNGGSNLEALSGTPTDYVRSDNQPGADPLFVDAAGGDFHLQPGSPAINKGLDVGLTSDFDGNSVVGLPDIGAFESQ